MLPSKSENDSEYIELTKVFARAVGKHEPRKITDKLKEIDIEDGCQNYQKVRDFVLENVCSLMNVTKDEVITKGKRGTVTVARRIAIVVIKLNFDISDEDLARFFNGRARQVVYKIMKDYKTLQRDNKTDQKNFFCHFDIVNQKTIEYLYTLKK